jgi:hypothetical protein
MMPRAQLCIQPYTIQLSLKTGSCLGGYSYLRRLPSYVDKYLSVKKFLTLAAFYSREESTRYVQSSLSVLSSM